VPSFNLGFFDGNTSGLWDIGTTPLVYTLYADPNVVGDTSIQVAQWTGSQMADNAWTDFTVTQDLRAQAPSGAYFYHLHGELPGWQTVRTWSNFKIRSSAAIELSLNESFAYSIPAYTFNDVNVLYPSGFPTDANPTVPTTFDGTWDMYVNVPSSSPYFSIWDGDMDHGSNDCTVNDTDDPDTLNEVLPSWATAGPTNLEGVATTTNPCRNSTGGIITGPAGQTYATGNPADDALSIFFRRSPAITYVIEDPNGNVYSNDNPSGNQEWEQFRIDSDAGTPADYHVNGLLPTGIYHIHLAGLDITNLNAWYLLGNTTSVCVHEDGTPCIPILAPYLVGDAVWLDANGNGVQDSGEAGIPDVTVTLLDENGQPIGTAVTNVDGKYSFEVQAGTYTVQVDASNFDAGGALAGLVSTTGGELQTNTVTTDNVLTYDFGYRNAFSGNFCGFIRTPGFWKNYKNHMSDATFLNLVQHTQDFSYLTVKQAVKILGTNNGKTNLGIPELDGVDARFLKFLLTAEINAVWNGEDNATDLGGALGIGFYQGAGMTVNQLLHQAYLVRRTFSTAEDNYVVYLGAGGENSSQSACLVQSLP
jgi:hypothetical protein